MSKYTITVEEFAAELNKMIASGHGRLPLVVSAGMFGGACINPISGLGVGPVEVARDGLAKVVEYGPDEMRVAFIETPAMLPQSFWKNHFSAESL